MVAEACLHPYLCHSFSETWNIAMYLPSERCSAHGIPVSVEYPRMCGACASEIFSPDTLASGICCC